MAKLKQQAGPMLLQALPGERATALVQRRRGARHLHAAAAPRSTGQLGHSLKQREFQSSLRKTSHRERDFCVLYSEHVYSKLHFFFIASVTIAVGHLQR